jgi:hypothetical protein
VGVDGENSLGNFGNFISSPNPLFGLWRGLRERVGEGIHILYVGMCVLT